MTTVSVVTGGAGAMGAACALALAPTVDVVLLADRDGDRLGSIAERLGSTAAAVSVSTLAGDLGEPEAVAELAARARELGRLASLVHTAGSSFAFGVLAGLGSMAAFADAAADLLLKDLDIFSDVLAARRLDRGDLVPVGDNGLRRGGR